jgi:hypothetical protein
LHFTSRSSLRKRSNSPCSAVEPTSASIAARSPRSEALNVETPEQKRHILFREFVLYLRPEPVLANRQVYSETFVLVGKMAGFVCAFFFT